MELGEKILKTLPMRICAGLVVLWEDRILLVQEKYDKKGSYLSIPKGEIEANESPLDAAVRETYEETGILIDKGQIEPHAHIINIDNNLRQVRIIYFLVRLKEDHSPNIIIDKQELTWAGFITVKAAYKKLQVSQKSILFAVNYKKLDEGYIDWLVNQGYIRREKHPIYELCIYNYTAKCKAEQYWNEVTLWCRGLITDAQNNIIYKPLKKFFESSQLYDHFVPASDDYEICEKIDGSFGILYHVNGIPHIATRGSFISHQAIKGESILYSKYLSALTELNPDWTYFFEIVYPQDKHIVDYGDTEDIFLLGAYDNPNNAQVRLCHLNVPFPIPKIIRYRYSIDELLSMDDERSEGFVLTYTNGFRAKVKFQSYKLKHTHYRYEEKPYPFFSDN